MHCCVRLMKVSDGTPICVIALALSCFAALTLLISGPHMSTEFPPGYSEERFQEIEIGDSKHHVVEVLGDPFRIVGDHFVYRYLYRNVNFEVNTRTGIVSVKHYFGEGEIPNELLELTDLQQLIEKLGQPDLIVRAHGGQSHDPSELTYIYSRKSGWWFYWQYRIVYIHKETGQVTSKLATRVSEF